jgi:hypothetical protein
MGTRTSNFKGHRKPRPHFNPLESSGSMLFITCFCSGAASPFHVEKYGSVCLRFTRLGDGPPPLVLNGFGGDRWFSAVTYGESDQRRVVGRFLKEVSILLLKHSSGSAEWSRREWMGSTSRRDLGQCLLTIAASFKRKKFRRDPEGRLIFSPSLSLSNSAPGRVDERFRSLIESQPRRHVSLRREAAFPPREGEMWPPALGNLEPYDDVVHSPTPTRWAKVIAFAKVNDY